MARNWSLVREWECKMMQPLWKDHGSSTEIQTLHYHVTPKCHFWAYTPEELKARSQRDICISMSNAALFIIAKRWKHSICPSVDKQNMAYANIAIFFTLKRKDTLHSLQY